MELTNSYPQDMESLLPFLQGITGKFVRRRCGVLPASIDFNDLYHEAVVTTIEQLPKFQGINGASVKSFLYKRVVGRFYNVIARSHVGPSASNRPSLLERGKSPDWGEISIQAIPYGEEWLYHSKEDECPTSIIDVPIREGAKCLKELRQQMAEDRDTGISFYAVRNKWVVYVYIQRKKQYAGIYKTQEEAKEGKRAFLQKMIDTVINEMIDSGEEDTAHLQVAYP